MNAALPEGLPPILLRIGIPSGRMTLGYVGGGGRGALDAIGDPVNVAARLEALCKSDAFDGDVRIAVGDGAAALVKSDIAGLALLGAFQLRGKADDVEVWRLAPPGS